LAFSVLASVRFIFTAVRPLSSCYENKNHNKRPRSPFVLAARTVRSRASGEFRSKRTEGGRGQSTSAAVGFWDLKSRPSGEKSKPSQAGARSEPGPPTPFRAAELAPVGASDSPRFEKGWEGQVLFILVIDQIKRRKPVEAGWNCICRAGGSAHPRRSRLFCLLGKGLSFSLYY
jgi:hypothetical protein